MAETRDGIRTGVGGSGREKERLTPNVSDVTPSGMVECLFGQEERALDQLDRLLLRHLEACSVGFQLFLPENLPDATSLLLP